MLSMEERKKIRDLYYKQGIGTVAEIARITGYNRKTVTKYIDMDDLSSAPQSLNIEHHSKLDPYKPLIESWLTSDKDAPRKERHTARKIHNRLMAEAEGYDCSYRTVACFVAEWKQKMEKK